MHVEMVVRLTPADGSEPVELTFEQANELHAQLGTVLHKVPVFTPVETKPPTVSQDKPGIHTDSTSASAIVDTSAGQSAPPVPAEMPRAFIGRAKPMMPLQTPPQTQAAPMPTGGAESPVVPPTPPAAP